MDVTSLNGSSNNNTQKILPTIIITTILVALADYLFFLKAMGINVFIFMMIISIATILNTNTQNRTKYAALLLALAAALPFIETSSFSAFVVGIIGISIVAFISAGILPRDLTNLPAVLLKFFLMSLFRIIADLAKASLHLTGIPISTAIKRHIVVLIIPLGFLFIFILLFRAANPIIDLAFNLVDISLLFQTISLSRIILWVLSAAATWALLKPAFAKILPKAQKAAVHTVKREDLLFGTRSIRLSLVLFNILFAAQSALDITYLWGGIQLPDGLDYADYAHRGAYPLVATALLAAGFTLVAMRANGPGVNNSLIKKLVLVWVAQNILLCVSAILRLDLYVEIYSLTQLRLAAGVWMILVAIGLVLIIIKIFTKRSNRWLVTANFCTLLSTLYISAVIDTGAVVAHFNVRHSLEITGTGTALDIDYLEQIGPTTIPALDFYIDHIDDEYQDKRMLTSYLRDRLLQKSKSHSKDWRGWSLRQWRLTNYILKHDTPTPAAEKQTESQDDISYFGR